MKLSVSFNLKDQEFQYFFMYLSKINYCQYQLQFNYDSESKFFFKYLHSCCTYYDICLFRIVISTKIFDCLKNIKLMITGKDQNIANL